MIKNRNKNRNNNKNKNRNMLYATYGVTYIVIIIYLVLSVFSLSRLYATAYNNLEGIKKDNEIIGVIEWEEVTKGNFKITDTDGDEKELESPVLSIVLNDGKDLAYYSEDEDILMIPVGSSYVNKFLLGSGFFIVFLGDITIVLSLIGIKARDMRQGIKSGIALNIILVSGVILGVLLGVYSLISYLMFV